MLMELNEIWENQFFVGGNVRTHVAIVVDLYKKSQQVGSEVLLCLPYSREYSPADYHAHI